MHFRNNMASSTLGNKARKAFETPPSSQKPAVEEVEHDGPITVPQLATPATPISPPENDRPRKRRRIINRITRPEPGSLYDILHENQGESLFTIPICWTDQHSKLLDVQWIHRDTVREPVPDFNSMSFKYPPHPTRIATELSKDLTTILSPSDSSPLSCACIKNVMSTLFPATLSKPRTAMDFELRIGNRVLKRAVRAPVLWKQYEYGSHSFDSASTRIASTYGRIPSSSREACGTQSTESSRDSSLSTSPQPVLVFINRDSLDTIRRSLYRVVPGPPNGDRRNTPVANLQTLRSKKLIPQNADHDPYMVAIMIAVAQWYCYPPMSKPSSRSSSQRSSQAWGPGPEMCSQQPDFKDIPIKVITQQSNTAEFVVCSAVVTAAFLRRFDRPSKAPKADDPLNGGLKIEVTKVPIWPVLGLKERLAKALGPEIAGDMACADFADGDIETWETEKEREFRTETLKRKRGTLYEALNRGLEMADESVEPPSSGSGMGVTVASPPLSPRTPKRRRTQSTAQLEVC
ncbi:hypothetical protein SLS53_001139 [Cytospora paraplurivora]|uniref:Uncharacterized protein n=1 Tax=Cytospora paraplurivora TaxID=2898453 RepID=A0AAN9YM80_9PEZI